MTNNLTPTQEVQTIDNILQKLVWHTRGNWGINKREAKQAIESYCAERDRLARIDELDRFMSSKAIEKVVLGKEIDKYYNQRLAELQQQSSSQEEDD